MIFADFFDKLGDAFILSIPTILALVGGYFQIRKDSLHAAQKVANKVESVESKLNHSTNNTDSKLETIHLLVDSQMGSQKRMLAVTTRAKAAITNDPVDLAEAETAEEDYRDHQLKQSKVDTAKDKEPPTGDQL